MKIQIKNIWNEAPTARGKREVPGWLMVRYREPKGKESTGRTEEKEEGREREGAHSLDTHMLDGINKQVLERGQWFSECLQMVGSHALHCIY